jgi:hypothetical protein
VVVACLAAAVVIQVGFVHAGAPRLGFILALLCVVGLMAADQLDVGISKDGDARRGNDDGARAEHLVHHDGTDGESKATQGTRDDAGGQGRSHRSLQVRALRA